MLLIQMPSLAGLHVVSLSTAALLMCRTAMKKAVEAVRAASQTQEPPSCSKMVDSIEAVQNQIQTAPPETVTAVTESMCLFTFYRRT